ncbi:MAG: UDP-2,3-diacylglucosamine diphosphatase [Luminiphilus sp.]
MLEIKPNDVLKCRTIWISDVHLGSKYCKAKQLLEFLDRIEFEQLYLVGDIVDLLAMRRRVHWPTAHNRVISRFMKLARRKRSRVIYIPGNHDFAFRSMVKNNLGKIAVHRTFVHETVDGKRMLVTHGDELDYAVRFSRVNRIVGDIAYEVMMWSNTKTDQLRERLGLPYWSLAKWIKRNSAKAEEAIDAYQRAAIAMAKDKGFDGIICGHLHYPTIREVDGVRYLNDGDWVENCSALIELNDGQIRLYKGMSHPTSVKDMIFVDATDEFSR